MRGGRSLLRALMLLPSIALAAEQGNKCVGVGAAQEWVDLDTPAEACVTHGKGGLPFKLVFSDEFELAGRSFKDGDDARWTGIDSWPGGNAQVSYYNGSLPVTHAGKLHLPVVKHFVPPLTDDTGMSLEGTEKYYQTAMIQTWNKFCFSRSGIVEMKARLPGQSTMPGLWPAFWIMGNLGRATLEDSTDGIWPFSYDECVKGDSEDCETSQCHSQRISACDANPGHGLNPHQGRGSPEVDILEAMPGSPKTTGAHSVFHCRPHDGTDAYEKLDKDLMGYLQMPRPQLIGSYQVAPGMPRGAIERPQDACMPRGQEWYKWNLSKFEKRFWYEGATPPDPGMIVMPTYEFFGSNLTKSRDSMNLQSPGEAAGDPNTMNSHGVEGGGDHPQWVQTDSLSATTPLTPEKWAEEHVFAMEWRANNDGTGYMRWSLDGDMYFELPESLLKRRMMHFADRKGGMMGDRMLPMEPMYLILNVDMSPNWGWPEWHRCGLGECDCCLDCSNPNCTTCMVEMNFTNPRNEITAMNVKGNAFEWFKDMCKKLPNLDSHPKLGIESGLLDLSMQVDYVRVYQPEESIDVGCDPGTFPTAQWIDDHERDYRPHGMEKPIKSVVPGGASCSNDWDCAYPRGSCHNMVKGDPGVCHCADGWVGPKCMSQAAGIAAQCALFEDAHMRAITGETVNPGPQCRPPSDYNRTMLQHVIDALCLSDFTAGDGEAELNKTCADVAMRGGMYFPCSEPAKAAALTTALAAATVAADGSGGRCCNAVTFGTKRNGEPVRTLLCRAADAPGIPADGVIWPANTGKGGNQLGSGWLSIIGGGTILGGLVGIAMYVKHRSRRDALTPAGDDYHRITEPQ